LFSGLTIADDKILFPASPLANRLTSVGEKSIRINRTRIKLSGLNNKTNRSGIAAHRIKILCVWEFVPFLRGEFPGEKSCSELGVVWRGARQARAAGKILRRRFMKYDFADEKCRFVLKSA
jgi:hypothetical protein